MSTSGRQSQSSSEELVAAADAQEHAGRAAAFLEAAKVKCHCCHKSSRMAPVRLCQPLLQSKARCQASSLLQVGAEELCPPPSALPGHRATSDATSAPLAHLCHHLDAVQPSSDTQPTPSLLHSAPATNDSSTLSSPAAGQGAAALPASAYNSLALQLWVLGACQGRKGGLRDKPGKPPDYYHTCYCLSGLASSQHTSRWVLGPPSNLLPPADPLCNVLCSRLAEGQAFFGMSAP